MLKEDKNQRSITEKKKPVPKFGQGKGDFKILQGFFDEEDLEDWYGPIFPDEEE